jgi:nucleoside 2-deoxyribosyltransferase
MERADAGLFNLSNFRGPSADAGTVFELGFLFAQGKPVYGYSSSVGNYLDRVSALEGSLVKQEGRFLDGNGYAVEDFGLIDNLMIVRAIEDAGGSVVTVEEKDGEPLAAFRALRETLAILRSRLD